MVMSLIEPAPVGSDEGTQSQNANSTTEMRNVAGSPPPKSGYTYKPLLLDLLARYATYGIWRTGLLPSWLFWILQAVVIPVVQFYWVDHRIKRARLALKLDATQKFVLASRPQWTVFVVAVSLNNALHPFYDVRIGLHWLRILLAITLSLAALWYTVGVASTSASGEVIETKANDDYVAFDYVAFDPIDENDRLLTKLQTKLADLSRKVESYTIESTLIGAISFSAFVTIAAAEKVKMVDVQALVNQLILVLRTLGSAQNAAARAQLSHTPTETTVLISAAFTALVCSMFFMVVIAARLRFNSLIGPVSFSTEMAANFNQKEEEIYSHINIHETNADSNTIKVHEERLLQLRDRINNYLNQARAGVDQIDPVIRYMTISRAFGLVSFLITLVISALWFAPLLSGLFTLLAVITFVYPWLDALRDGKLRKIDFMLIERFTKRSRRLAG
jgi:hypothetical protein